jgi:succinate-acetate transporter protein
MILSVTLAIAGIFCFFYDAKTDAVLFLLLGSTGFSGALRFVIYPNLEANTAPSMFDGWSSFFTGVVILYLWLVSMKSNPFKQFFLLSLWLALFGSAITNWFPSMAVAYISGYLGLIAAVLAGLYFASTVLPSKKSAV